MHLAYAALVVSDGLTGDQFLAVIDTLVGIREVLRGVLLVRRGVPA